MKKIFTYVLAMVALAAQAQLVSDQTNGVRLSFKEDRTGKEIMLPTITWDYPAREYTNSEDRRVNFKASVESTAVIKEIAIELYRGGAEKPLSTRPIEIGENLHKYEFEQQMFLFNGENEVKEFDESV